MTRRGVLSSKLHCLMLSCELHCQQTCRLKVFPYNVGPSNRPGESGAQESEEEDGVKPRP